MNIIDTAWWIQVVELPILGGLFLWMNKSKNQTDINMEKLRGYFATTLERMQRELADYKLEVARTYASMSYIKDVETRLTNHLLRIEQKLEKGEN